MSLVMTRAEAVRWAEKVAANDWPWTGKELMLDLSLIAIWLGLLFVLYKVIRYSDAMERKGVNSGLAIFLAILATWSSGFLFHRASFGDGPVGYGMYNVLGPENFVWWSEFVYKYLTITGVFTW